MTASAAVHRAHSCIGPCHQHACGGKRACAAANTIPANTMPAQELSEWRVRINGQVKSYQVEVGGLRSKLSSEMEALKKEFLDLRSSLQEQMEATWAVVGKAEDDEEETITAVDETPAAAQVAEEGTDKEL